MLERMKRFLTPWIGAAVLAGITSASHSAEVPAEKWDAATWIRLDGDPRPDSPLLERLHKGKQKRKAFPAPLMRREFVVSADVKQATAHVCGLGYFELYLNGAKVGDHVLDPVQTTYDVRACYVTLDITQQLQAGENAVGLMLGNGFYGQNAALSANLSYGEPLAIALIEIEYADGKKETVMTDKSWTASTGAILFDNVYVGESYDARLEIPGWSKAGFDDSKWTPVKAVKSPTKKLLAQQQQPMKKIKAIPPVAVLPAKDGAWILDMGVNMTGWLQIRANEKRGTQIKMRFAEHLTPDGKMIDTASTGIHVTGSDQTSIYVCKGGGVEEWEPRFSYHGFRYVQIDGLSEKPKLDDFTGWLIRTAAERMATFDCSDPLLKKFYDVSMWTIECNIQGILTDCPHREKCAWMGDMHAVGEAATLNYDLKEFWRKSSADMDTVKGRAGPHPDSKLPRDRRVPTNVAVGKRLCLQARPDWGVATVLVPWYNYLYHGEPQIVAEAWPLMSGWMDFMDEFAQQDGIVEEGYGDWCPPGGNGKIDTPKALSSTAYYYQALQVMARMAEALEKNDDAKSYAAAAEKVRSAFNEKFFNAETGDYGSQTGTVMALHLGLVPEGKIEAVSKALADRIMTLNKGHYTTGIHGHRALYTVLNDAGFAKVSETLLHQTDYPSLAFLTETHGLTTWPEVPYDWPEGQRYRRNSFNHPMHSGFAVMFHESIGGIRPDPDFPGFERVILKPSFLSGLEWAKADHRSPRGLISSRWERKGEELQWNVVLPEDTTGEIWLPQSIKLNGEGLELLRSEGRWNIYEAGAGEHLLSLADDGS